MLCGVEAQYISEVLDYSPAPGQFINSSPWGTPQSALSIVGGIQGSLSLGSFGGTVVFRFAGAVENHPDNPYGVDFTIFGNPMANWAEPGVVFVMEDENGNGKADDSWYELAGSDYYFSSTKPAYMVSYSNPGGTVAADVPWVDEEGNYGYVRANSVHLQTYYPLSDSFPGVPTEDYNLSGTLIKGAVDVDHPPLLISVRRAFGYADNQVRGRPPFTLPDNPYTPEVENSGGDAFDISWAVNDQGKYIELERIHFVKVQTGILHEGGYLGEVSTEITGALDVPPATGISGNTALLLIKDLLPETSSSSVQLEAKLFRHGRLVEGSTIRWSTSEDWALVDKEQQLIMDGTGPLTISATVDEEPLVSASVSTLVIQNQATPGKDLRKIAGLVLYPNPAGELFQITGVDGAPVSLFDASGRLIAKEEHYRSGMKISCAEFVPGVYLVKIGKGSGDVWFRLVKQ